MRQSVAPANGTSSKEGEGGGGGATIIIKQSGSINLIKSPRKLISLLCYFACLFCRLILFTVIMVGITSGRASSRKRVIGTTADSGHGHNEAVRSSLIGIYIDNLSMRPTYIPITRCACTFFVIKFKKNLISKYDILYTTHKVKECIVKNESLDLKNPCPSYSSWYIFWQSSS